jgi:glycosyltransferase involved in cell wall biosynthesis
MREHPRIAIVAAGPDIVGGQGVQAVQLVNALRGDGADVTFLAINRRFPAGLGWVRRVPYVRTAVNQLLYLPSLARLAAADVVHAFSASYASFLLAPAPAMVAGRLLNKRVVLHYHSGEADDHLARWGALVHPWLRLAHEIVVPSAYLQHVFARHGYEARVVPNVVDVSRFRFRERTRLTPRFLSARNLEPIYRVDVVLQGFARIHKQCPTATLTVAGHGSEEPRLKDLASSLACKDRIRFVGKIDPDDMPRLYAATDIFLNASVVDNQPVSILEAFAAGLPVVSTATGDIASMVRDGQTGFIVRAGNPEALALAAMAMLQNPNHARAMACRARQEVERFTWTAVRDKWADVYGNSPKSQVASPKSQPDAPVTSRKASTPTRDFATGDL